MHCIGAVAASHDKEAQVGSLDTVEKKSLELEVKTPKGAVTFKIDSGADVTCIGKQHLEQFGLQKSDLKTTRKRLKGADNKNITCLYIYLFVFCIASMYLKTDNIIFQGTEHITLYAVRRD